MDVETFLTEFGHIANALGGVQTLREMIYHLAITGKLVRQNNNYDHAQDLINIIALTKDRLIKNKFFKRSPKLEKIPLIIPNDIIIPDNWIWTQLVKLGEINPKNNVEDGVRVSFIPMRGVSQLHLGAINSEERQWSEINKGYTHFTDGDVLLAKITPCYENRKSAILYGLKNGIGAGSTEFHVIRPIKGLVEPAYIYTFLRSPYFMVDGEKKMTGTAGQKRLPTEYFATRAFPLPPLQEQKRIVAKVDELMALCDRLEAMQKKLGKLTKLFRTASLNALANAQSPQELKLSWNRVQENLGMLFEGPEDIGDIRKIIIELGVNGCLTKNEGSDNSVSELIDTIHRNKKKLIKEKIIKHKKPIIPFKYDRRIPEHWMVTSLDSVISTMDAGWSPACSPHPCSNSESWGILKTTAVQKMKYLEFEHKELPIEKDPKPQYEAKAGDILVTRAGPKNRVGICCVINSTRQKLMISDKIIRFHIVNDLLNTNFIAMALTVGESASILENQKSGMAESQMNISQNKLRAIPISIPPIEEQDRIVSIVESFLEKCNKLESQLTKARFIAEKLAQSAIAAITGTQLEDKRR